jgi:hypothetical protein
MTKNRRKILLLEPSNVFTHQFLGFDSLIQEVQEAHGQCYEKRQPFFVQMGRALRAANTYAPVIDVMIQQQPFVVNLVWGSIRFIIQVSDALFIQPFLWPA